MVTALIFLAGGSCLFCLTDDDVESFAIALPSLVTLRLGRACESNTCRTTVNSLFSISSHCPELTCLEIHFNTLSIAGDMRRLFNRSPRHDKPRCKLRTLPVGRLPLLVRQKQVRAIAAGFADIFPCLEKFPGEKSERRSWNAVASKLRD